MQAYDVADGPGGGEKGGDPHTHQDGPGGLPTGHHQPGPVYGLYEPGTVTVTVPLLP